MMTDADSHADVLVVGGGVAGLMVGTYTARADLDTLVVDSGESILERNAHLENVPGFPAGVDARLFLRMTRDGAERAGCRFHERLVTDLSTANATDEARFAVELETGNRLTAEFVVAASWADVDYLDDVEGIGLVSRGSKTFVDVDEHGSTGVDGLYAAGRIAEQPHQTAIAAGHGARVALAVMQDADVPFYHDWVVPEGYFTGRDRDVPPGCEEIDDAERRRREAESREVMQEYFADPAPGEPTMHPSVDQSE